jgi:hypothetical protein
VDDVDDDDDDTGGDYLFEHISSMNKMSKVGGGGRDDTTTKSGAVMSADIDGLAAIVAQTVKSMKKSDGTTKTIGSGTTGIPCAPQALYSPPPDKDHLANLVFALARKHGHNTMLVSGINISSTQRITKIKLTLQ